jgi:hypothetical protein
VWVGVGIAVVVEVVARARGRARMPLTVLAAIALAWLGAVVLQVERGLVGTPRYFMGSAAVLAVVGAAGWALAMRAGASLPAGAWARWAAGGVAAAAIAAGLVVYGVHQGDELGRTADNVSWLAHQRDDLPRVIAAAGGRRRIVSCGTTTSRKIQLPLLAWYLHVPVERIDWRRVHPRGYVIQARTTTSRRFRPKSRRESTTVASSKYWRVRAASCPTASHV